MASNISTANELIAGGCLGPRLPLLDYVQRPHQHDDVEREVVVDDVADRQFENHCKANGREDGQARCDENPQHHRQNITD